MRRAMSRLRRHLSLGEPLLDGNGQIAASIPFDVLAAHVWWSETGTGWNAAGGGRGATALPKSLVLGVHDGVAYALLYNGILKDRRVDGGNVLTRKTLALIKEDLAKMCAGGRGRPSLPAGGGTPALPDGVSRIIVFGEWNKLGAEAVAAKSGGRFVYATVYKTDGGLDVRGQLDRAFGR